MPIREILFNDNVRLSVNIENQDDFVGVSFDEFMNANLEVFEEDQDLTNSRALNEYIDYEFSITRDYDFAVEQSEAVENFFDNMMFIVDEINDPTDKRIEHPLFGVIEDWSSMGGLLQLNVVMQLFNAVYNASEALPAMGLRIERKLSSGGGG